MTTAQHGTTSAHNDALGGSPESQTRERTPWLLAFLCLLIPMLPGQSVPAGPLKSYGSPAKLIAIALCGLVILGFVLIRRTRRTTGVRPGMVVLLAYALLVLLLYGIAVSHTGSPLVESGRGRAIFATLAHVGVAAYAMTRIQTLRQRNIVLGCLAIGLTFNCVAGLLQSFTHIDLQLLFQPPGFVINVDDQGQSLSPVITDRLGANRAFGTSGHAIEFSVLAAVAVPLTVHFARYAASRQVRLFAALAAVVAVLAMPAGVSRSGVVALVAAMLVYVWAFKLRELGSAVLASAVVFLAGFAASPGTARALWLTITNAGEDESVLERIGDYTRVSQTFHDHPLFGLGLGASPPAEYGFLDNEWLQAIVQGGIVGLFGMFVLAGGAIFGIAAALRCATSGRERDQAYAMGAMLVGILASSFTFDLFSYQQATLVFFLLFGLLWSNFTLSPEATHLPERHRMQLRR